MFIGFLMEFYCYVWAIVIVYFVIKHISHGMGPKYRSNKIDITVLGSEQVVLNSYPGSIAQIISQLILNSINHAFEDQSNCQIKIRIEETFQRSEAMLRLIYSDNGSEMALEIQEKIFEAFYTTKRANGGSGIGMALVYNLVTQRLGGYIEVKSEPGKGSRFDIVFPININDTYIKKVV